MAKLPLRRGATASESLGSFVFLRQRARTRRGDFSQASNAVLHCPNMARRAPRPLATEARIFWDASLEMAAAIASNLVACDGNLA